MSPRCDWDKQTILSVIYVRLVVCTEDSFRESEDEILID